MNIANAITLHRSRDWGDSVRGRAEAPACADSTVCFLKYRNDYILGVLLLPRHFKLHSSRK